MSEFSNMMNGHGHSPTPVFDFWWMATAIRWSWILPWPFTLYLPIRFKAYFKWFQNKRIWCVHYFPKRYLIGPIRKILQPRMKIFIKILQPYRRLECTIPDYIFLVEDCIFVVRNLYFQAKIVHFSKRTYILSGPFIFEYRLFQFK